VIVCIVLIIKNGRIDYLSVIYYTLKNSNSDSNMVVNMYIEMSSRVPFQVVGYAELVVNRDVNTIDYKKYSYAHYINGELVYRMGQYIYNFYDNNYPKPVKEDYLIFDKNDYKHLIKKIDSSSYIIVSEKNRNIWLATSNYSGFFCRICFSYYFIG
jgi:hypothetical protein